MRIFVMIIGLLLLPSLADASMYTDMLKLIDQEQYQFVLEPESAKEWIQSAEDDTSGIEYKYEHLKDSLRTYTPAFCPGGQLINCIAKTDEFKQSYLHRQKYRDLAREMAKITHRYEEPVVDFEARRRLPVIQQSLLNMWRAGTEILTSPFAQPELTGITLTEKEEKELNDLVDDLSVVITDAPYISIYDKLNEVEIDQFVAMVRRYRYGYKYLPTTSDISTPCTVGQQPELDNTMLQYRLHRWCEVEQLLEKIHEKTIEIWERYGSNPNVIFPSFDIDYYHPILDQKQVKIWINHKDVGFTWDQYFDPVFLSYECDKDSDLPTCNSDTGFAQAGLYINQQGSLATELPLCSQHILKNGFLCRPLDSRSNYCSSIEDNNATGSTIDLISCRETKSHDGIFLNEHFAGPNMCEIGDWRTLTTKQQKDYVTRKGDTVTFNAPDCAECSVEITCKGLPDGLGGLARDKENGTIRIEINNNNLPFETYALTVHEIVHAQQHCRLPDGHVERLKSNDETSRTYCCAVEQEAYLAECHIFEEQGWLDTLNVSPQKCAEYLTNWSCNPDEALTKSDGTETSACTDVPPDDINDFYTNIYDAANNHTGYYPYPTTCDELLTKLEKGEDPRLKSMLSGFLNSASPQCEAEYKNTIGNNLCYLGQAIEESIQDQRLLPGRAPFVMGEQSFPFDACSESDQVVRLIEEGNNDVGDHIYLDDLPTVEPPRFPKYTLQSLIHKLDEQLCERLGMPRYLPVSFCIMRQPAAATITQHSISEKSFNMLEGHLGEEDTARKNSIILDGLVQRVITKMYSEFGFQHHTILEAILASVVEHYTAVSKVKFPETMCSTLLPSQGDFCRQLTQ